MLQNGTSQARSVVYDPVYYSSDRLIFPPFLTNHRELANVLKYGISVLSGDVNNEMPSLVNALQNIHDTLAEYQVHEAREVMLMDMRSKISRLREMKESMERFVNILYGCMHKGRIHSYLNEFSTDSPPLL